MKKLLLHAVISVSLMINSSQAARLRIVGGQTTDIIYLPYQAAYLANGKLKCGASIISNYCALTAGNLKDLRNLKFIA
jgi:hypothetical protein